MATKYTKTNEKFVNPYNFVSLDEKCEREQDYKKIKESQGLHTGWIECELRTLTPIFIPNTSDSKSDIFGERTVPDPQKPNEQPKIIKSYDFFSYVNLDEWTDNNPPAPTQPVIPGSEIRGMIRSAYEALTSSCMSTTDANQKLYKRTTSPAKCGFLKYNEKSKEWLIYKCKKYGLAKRTTAGDPNDFSSEIKNLYDGQEVYIKATGREYMNRRKISLFEVVDDIIGVDTDPTTGVKIPPKPHDYMEGWFHRGEKLGDTNRKHHESVFVLQNPRRPEYFKVPDEAVRCLLENIKIYNDPKINLFKKNGNHTGYKDILDYSGKDIKDLEVEDLNFLPVYYAEHSGNYYLSPSNIGREVFYNSLQKILEKRGGYQPCNDITNLCSACSVFGLVSKNNSVASRLRFADANLKETEEKNDLFEEVKILPELANPKPSATEFYLIKPNGADMWNYDYAFRWGRYNGKATNPATDINNYNPMIKGRKFYWHQKIDTINDIPDNNSDDKSRSVAVRPLNKGKTFKFRVYFDDLTEDELKKVIWALEIGGKKDNAHKIGMGKPLGLGSVRVSIIDVKERVVKLENSRIEYEIDSMKTIDNGVSLLEYVRKQSNPENILGCSKKVLDEFLKISDFKNSPGIVCYPKNKNLAESYKWFMGNKQADGTGGKGITPVICQPLPGILNPELHRYEEYEDRR